MKKYEARLSAGKIDEVEIARQTECFVIFENGQREGKDTEYNSYHDTRAEAKAWLVQKAQRQVDNLLVRLKHAQGVLDSTNAIEV